MHSKIGHNKGKKQRSVSIEIFTHMANTFKLTVLFFSYFIALNENITNPSEIITRDWNIQSNWKTAKQIVIIEKQLSLITEIFTYMANTFKLTAVFVIDSIALNENLWENAWNNCNWLKNSVKLTDNFKIGNIKRKTAKLARSDIHLHGKHLRTDNIIHQWLHSYKRTHDKSTWNNYKWLKHSVKQTVHSKTGNNKGKTAKFTHNDIDLYCKYFQIDNSIHQWLHSPKWKHITNPPEIITSDWKSQSDRQVVQKLVIIWEK